MRLDATKRSLTMPAVFVHGVPETAAIWNDIRSALQRTDTVALALPGFGCDPPSGFVADKEHYVDWVISQLEGFDEPVDLVGHDWGCLITQRVVSLRPDLVRTWAAGGGPVDATYVWHETAQVWQTPGVGEEFMAMMTPELLAAALVDELGPAAADMAEHVDERMRACILTLYRSAVDVGREWQPAVEALGASRPALVLWGRDDTYAPPEMGRRLAARVGAEFVELPCGHFWPVLEAQSVAAHLERFWTRH